MRITIENISGSTFFKKGGTEDIREFISEYFNVDLDDVEIY
jgi:hypothetical protein